MCDGNSNSCEICISLSYLQEEGNFQVIAIGVDILVKYGVNLLKPKRNPNWRSIKMSNGVFIKKVKPLKVSHCTFIVIDIRSRVRQDRGQLNAGRWAVKEKSLEGGRSGTLMWYCSVLFRSH